MLHRMVQLIVESLLTDKLGFVLPSNLGMLKVGGMKNRKDQRNPFIDRKYLCENGTYRPQLNLHSFGIIYTIDWIPLATTNFPNRALYKFKVVRDVNRNLAKRIFAGQQYLPRERNKYFRA